MPIKSKRVILQKKRHHKKQRRPKGGAASKSYDIFFELYCHFRIIRFQQLRDALQKLSAHRTIHKAVING